MSDETGVKCENAEDGDNVAETDTKTDTETKEPKETKPRTVSFNRDVHVKRFGKPRESRGASAEPAVRKEPFTHLSEQELIEEANKVLEQAGSITCSTDNSPDKFYSLPHRRKYKENRDRRNSDDAGIPDKKPLGRSTSDVSGKRGKERTSLSTLFRRNQKNKTPVAPIVVAATKKPVVVKRSKSDVSDLKSNTNLNAQSKPIRKRSGSESEEFLKSLRNKKAQLSPIIESSPRDDYFKRTPPLELFQKNKTVQKESSKSEDQTFKSDANKVNPIEKPPRYKTPEKVEPKPPVRTKRGKSLEKDSSPSITDTPKRKTDIKKTLLVDEIDNIKVKDINPVEVKERIKDSIRKLEENIYGDKEMIHSSQMPPDKPPLTRGHTVGTIIRKLKEDQLSPPKSHMISSMHSGSVNQPFSYTKPSVSPDPNLFVRNTSPDRIPSPVNKMNDKGVVYAHVVRDNSDTGYSNLAKQTVHKTYSPSRDKFGNISDEDEGLGYEDRHKYPSGRYNYNYKHAENDKFPSLEAMKITDSPIRPKFREYKLTSFNDFEPTYTNEYPSAQDKSHDFIETFRGRADGMDTMKKHFETDNKVDLDFDELRQRRELLESRIKSRRLEREPNVGEPISRFLAETDPIYEANKRMKATEKYVNETARYIHHTLERDGFAESSITEDYNRYDSDNHKVKYNTETRTYQKVPKGELDRREYIDSISPRGKDIPPEPEYEPPSLEFKTRKPFLSPNEYTEKKYKVKKHYTSSHDVQAGHKYREKDDEFGKRKGHYASNPEIAQERDDYSDIRYDAKQAETFHNSLRRVKNKDKYKESYGIKRHDSGDSRDYRDDRSPRRFDFDSRLVDSGIENDFRKDSGEIHRRTRGHDSDDDVRNTSLFLDSERRHTEDNYPSEQIYANGEYLARFKGYRDDEYRKGYPRDRSADDASHFDPKADRYDKSPTDGKVSAKPPKAKKLSGLEKMKQLFSRDSSKKSKKEKEAVQPKTRTRVLKSPEHLGDDDEEYKRYTDPEPSDIETKKREYDLKDEDWRYRSSREELDRHRSPQDDLERHKSPTHMEIRRSPRDDLDRHRPITHEIHRDPRDEFERRKSPITHMEMRRSPRSHDRRYGSGEDGERQRSSREDLDKYRSSKEDVRYRSLDPRDSDPERKYRETDFGTRSRYDQRTVKEDRRYVQRKEEKRRYTSSDRESDLQRSDAESDRRKTRSRTAGPVDSPVLAERYRERRRLATPSPRPSPTPSPPRQPATSAGNWFKSLDRLTRRKKNVKEEKASSVLTVDESHKPWKKPLNSPAKNLRFFGDTDQDSDATSKPSTKPRSHQHHSTLRKTVSNSSTGVDEIDHELANKSYSLTNLHKDKSESPRTKQYYKRNLHNINEVHSNSENESNLGRRASKPPINPYDRRSRSQSSSKTLKGSKGDLRRHRNEERGSSTELRGSRQELGSRELKHRRRTPANSGESSTEGESSQQSQRSVVFLHATTVGDIPDPGHLSRNRSRDDVSSVNSSNLQVRNTTKSFSIFAPWTPKHYSDRHDVHYSQRPRRPRPKETTFKKSSSTKNLTDDRPATLQKNKSYSQTTLARKPQNHRLTSSSSTLYRKPEKRGDNASVQSTTMSRKSLGRDKKSQSNEVLNRDGRDGISRSISMPKDQSKKAGWFKLTNKTKKQENTRVR